MLITTMTGPSGVDVASERGLGQALLPDKMTRITSQLAQLFSGTAWEKWDGTSGNFNCTTAICYGVGDKNHLTAVSLQAAINRFAAHGGFEPITTDGKIGSGTVKAGVKAAQLALTAPKFSALPLGPRTALTMLATVATVDKVYVTSVAPWLLEGFTKIADAASLPAVAAVIPERKPAPPEPAAAAARTEPPPAKKPSTTIWWVAGGVAAAALVGIISYAVYRSKKRRGLHTKSFQRRPRGEFAPGF